MKLICIGRNYSEHIKELKNTTPSDPVVFIKPDTSVLNIEQGFVIPEFSDDVHYEVELILKINKVGKYIDKKFAHKYYDQIGLGIDFTARDLQEQLKKQGLPWEKAKSFDGAAVVGNFLPKEEFADLDNIQFSLQKNEEIVQQGNSKDMIWNFDALIAYVSQYFTLKTGDVIFTGTPAGVGRVAMGDILKGYIGDTEMFSVKVK
ncbi:MAG TPA: fumarylacetoacetate hydrolase family protein [Flavobacteriaceae bacterium]|nr:fumarylacetoacetate hydrolase family protein [Flavobacteriaceae bacterium]